MNIKKSNEETKFRTEEKLVQQDRQGRWGKEFKAEGR